ncbi:hypothetical protein GMI70_01960 [Eggerthellaceae bacterium zg-893]|nr:hypothetical protein [Eggerthellaceae bacterium zg-893]
MLETIAAKFGIPRIIFWHRQGICTPCCRKTPFFGAFCHAERGFLAVIGPPRPPSSRAGRQKDATSAELTANASGTQNLHIQECIKPPQSCIKQHGRAKKASLAF